MHVRIYIAEDCPKCEAAKALAVRLAEHREMASVLTLVWTDTVLGRAEASASDVLATPTVLLCDDIAGKEIARWSGQCPTLKAIREAVPGEASGAAVERAGG